MSRSNCFTLSLFIFGRALNDPEATYLAPESFFAYAVKWPGLYPKPLVTLVHVFVLFAKPLVEPASRAARKRHSPRSAWASGRRSPPNVTHHGALAWHGMRIQGRHNSKGFEHEVT